MPRVSAICSAFTKLTDSARCGVRRPLSDATEMIFSRRFSMPHSSTSARLTGPFSTCAAKVPSFSASLISGADSASASPSNGRFTALTKIDPRSASTTISAVCTATRSCANTVEAQDRVAVQTAEMVVEALRGSIFVSAVNLPFEGLADAESAPLIKLAEKLGTFAAQVLNGPVNRAEVELWGIEKRLEKIISVASLKGLLTPHLAESVNFVNAEQIAETRGIAVKATTHPKPRDYANLITFRVSSATEE